MSAVRAAAGHCPCWRRGEDVCCGCDEPAKRKFYFVNEVERDDKGYIPSLMVEGVLGHRILWDKRWGTTLVEAQALCRQHNQDMGITPVDIAEIIESCQFPAYRSDGPDHTAYKGA